MKLLPLILIALALMAILNWVGAPLNSGPANLGIVSFELARTTEASNAILSAWDANARLHAAFSLGLDYLFMVAYAAAISVACLKSGRLLAERRWPLSVLSGPLAVAAWVAAAFDAVENVALTVILFNQAAVTPWPFVAWLCATLKFTLIFIGLVYAFYAGATFLVARMSGQRYQA